MLSRLFIAALSSPEEKGLTSWLLFVMFIVFLFLSNLVSWDRCCTWLYLFLIHAVFLTFKICEEYKMGHKQILDRILLILVISFDPWL